MTKRQNEILQVLNEQKKMEVAVLAERMNVSQVTIRKDLDALEQAGLVTREHGFARIGSQDDINNRLAVRYEVKDRIAHAAMELVEDGETVMIESGSTCAILARLLAEQKKDVHIITNSAFIAGRIRDLPGGSVTLLGGIFQKESMVCVGPLVQKCAKEFFVDKVFMGTDGFISRRGFTCGDMMRAQAMRALAESANKRIILTDSGKFTRQGVAAQLSLEEVTAVITDTDIPKEALERLKESGVEVILADAE